MPKNPHYLPPAEREHYERMLRLEREHDALCGRERDHHHIKHCLCDIALEWGRLRMEQQT